MYLKNSRIVRCLRAKRGYFNEVRREAVSAERRTDSIQPNANGDIDNDWYKLEHVGMDEKKIRVTLKENKNKERLMLSFTIIIDKNDFKDFFELRVYQPGTETSSNEM